MAKVAAGEASVEEQAATVEIFLEVKVASHKVWLDELRTMLPESIMEKFVASLSVMEDLRTS